jgi:antitoxin MazE
MERARIIKIGNSQGIRIPKPLLRQAGLAEEVELEVQQDRIVIHPVRRPRQGWEEQFSAMAEQGDDRLLDAEVSSLTRWDEDEWEW